MKCIFKNVEIKSIATCLPEKVVEMNSYAEKFGEKVYDSKRVMVKRRYIHPDVKAEYKLWKRINLKDYEKSCRRIKWEEK